MASRENTIIPRATVNPPGKGGANSLLVEKLDISTKCSGNSKNIVIHSFRAYQHSLSLETWRGQREQQEELVKDGEVEISLRRQPLKVLVSDIVSTSKVIGPKIFGCHLKCDAVMWFLGGLDTHKTLLEKKAHALVNFTRCNKSSPTEVGDAVVNILKKYSWVKNVCYLKSEQGDSRMFFQAAVILSNTSRIDEFEANLTSLPRSHIGIDYVVLGALFSPPVAKHLFGHRCHLRSNEESWNNSNGFCLRNDQFELLVDRPTFTAMGVETKKATKKGLSRRLVSLAASKFIGDTSSGGTNTSNGKPSKLSCRYQLLLGDGFVEPISVAGSSEEPSDGWSETDLNLLQSLLRQNGSRHAKVRITPMYHHHFDYTGHNGLPLQQSITVEGSVDWTHLLSRFKQPHPSQPPHSSRSRHSPSPGPPDYLTHSLEAEAIEEFITFVAHVSLDAPLDEASFVSRSTPPSLTTPTSLTTFTTPTPLTTPNMSPRVYHFTNGGPAALLWLGRLSSIAAQSLQSSNSWLVLSFVTGAHRSKHSSVEANTHLAQEVVVCLVCRCDDEFHFLGVEVSST
eukprot:GHVN01094771.1.p1 GENE.GHVN01094771.1~~GHVN01094771.1.p1  ORF type:complete len:567 (+),score=97.58 GHVN01094771.1:1141-2841(+)